MNSIAGLGPMSADPEYTYSQLSAESAGYLVAAHYGLRAPVCCKFFALGLHDNYLIECADGKYIFRIYRNNWRSPEEVLFELELLSFLNGKSAPVAGPVPTNTRELALRVESPEGERMAALFYYAQGHAPAESMTIEECVMLGRAVAKTHILSEPFKTTFTRRTLELPFLLDESIAAIEPFIDHDGLVFLGELQKKLHSVLPGLQKEAGIYGICTGDVNPGNFHISPDKHITLFDFDQCGYGFRAFEIGKFSSSIHSHKLKHALVGAFMEGYQQERTLSEEEYNAIPYFEMVSVIWVMAINAKNVNRIGYKYLDKSFWDRKLAVLMELHAQPHAQHRRA